MKIKRVSIWKEDLALTRPYTIAYETIDSVAALFVRLETANGLIGLGTASPAEDVTGESVSACETALATRVEPILGGSDIRFYRMLLRRLREALAPTPAALAAADIALHDLMGRALGLPLVELLGRAHDTLPTSITIGIKSVTETLAEAAEYTERGFSIFKVKTGLDVAQDVERLTRLREVYGARVLLRVDANQGYGPDDFRRFESQTRNLDIEFTEQPLPAVDIASMGALPQELRRHCAADESLLGPADALKCLHPPRPFGIFNIKLMKCGGIAPGLAIAELAHLAGIDLMWGCMDESVIGIAAALHAALASPATKYLDLDGHLDLARDVAHGGFKLEKGWMRTTDKPGLGVSEI